MFNKISSGLAAVSAATKNAATASKQNKQILAQVQNAAELWASNPFFQDPHPMYAASERKPTLAQIRMRPSIGVGQRRGIVTASTKSGLDAIHESLSTLPAEVPPFQKHDMCEFQAKDIVLAAHKSHETQRSNSAYRGGTEKVDSKSGGLWSKLMKAIASDPTIKTVAMQSTDQLLDIYNKNGPFVLRGPKLDDPRQGSGYTDHAIAIMAAVKVRIVDQGERIVFCAIDCNDAGKDEETMAAQQFSERQGKSLSVLTHEEADSFGADKRRIRLIDADSVVERLQHHTLHMNVREIEMESEIFFVTHGTPILNPEQINALEKFIRENWSEVEDYTAG